MPQRNICQAINDADDINDLIDDFIGADCDGHGIKNIVIQPQNPANLVNLDSNPASFHGKQAEINSYQNVEADQSDQESDIDEQDQESYNEDSSGLFIQKKRSRAMANHSQKQSLQLKIESSLID